MAGTVRCGSIAIRYVCEACDKEDHYVQKLEADYSDQRGNYKGPLIEAENRAAAIQRLTERKEKVLASYEEVELRKCPGCGRWQSWMANSLWRRGVLLKVAGLAVVAWLVLSAVVFITGPDTGDRLGQAVGLSVAVLFFVGIAAVVLYAALTTWLKGPRVDAARLSRPPTMAWRP